jgi:hypothetical protein
VFQIFDAITFALAYLVGAAILLFGADPRLLVAAVVWFGAIWTSAALDDRAYRPGVARPARMRGRPRRGGSWTATPTSIR